MDLINKLYYSGFSSNTEKYINYDINEIEETLLKEIMSFKNSLNDEQKEIFENIGHNQRLLSNLKLSLSYADGFKAGAKIMYDVFK